MNVWTYIHALLGSGSVWSKPREDIIRALNRSISDKNKEAEDHLRLILDRYDDVFLNKKEPRPKSGKNPR